MEGKLKRMTEKSSNSHPEINHLSSPGLNSFGATMCSCPPRKRSTSSAKAEANGSVLKMLLCTKHSTSLAPWARSSRAAVRPTSTSGTHFAACSPNPASASQFSDRAMMPTETPACFSKSCLRQPASGAPSGVVMFVKTHFDVATLPSNNTGSCSNCRACSTPKSKSWFPNVPTCTPKSSKASIMCLPLVKALVRDGARKSPLKQTRGLSLLKSRNRCQNRKKRSLRIPPDGVVQVPRL
mmetsp:Transcript_64786/g.163114  ORF Transcript_64786/g.163114 Transcript_64786/m.163114 type:complete len:239 (+) Transcript_64786:913-1629(+)